MGHYTRIFLAIDLRNSTPTDVMHVLNQMADKDCPREREIDVPSSVADHPLFATERWRWMLNSGDMCHFTGRAVLQWRPYDGMRPSLLLFTAIKNYTGECEALLDFLAPWVRHDGFVGYLLGEDDEHPTLLYAKEGKILMSIWPNVGRVAQGGC